jgi:hypothetical protein
MRSSASPPRLSGRAVRIDLLTPKIAIDCAVSSNWAPDGTNLASTNMRSKVAGLRNRGRGPDLPPVQGCLLPSAGWDGDGNTVPARDPRGPDASTVGGRASHGRPRRQGPSRQRRAGASRASGSQGEPGRGSQPGKPGRDGGRPVGARPPLPFCARESSARTARPSSRHLVFSSTNSRRAMPRVAGASRDPAGYGRRTRIERLP